MILSGTSIRERAMSSSLVYPFAERTEHLGMTYGLGPAGYDVRAEFDSEGSIGHLYVPPGGFALASTIENFNMPPDLIGFVCDKSSWARREISVFNTVIEPGWSGYLTLEITNHFPYQVTIERGSPIAQIVFQQIDAPSTYVGKYQHQGRGPRAAK